MKRGQEFWLLIFCLFALGFPALSQSNQFSGDENDGSGNVSRAAQPEATEPLHDPTEPMHAATEPLDAATEPLRVTTEPASAGQSSSPPAQTVDRPYGWHVAIYPVLAWVPFFGASVTLPPTPSQPIAPTGSTDGSFNGAYFGGARFEKGKWSADALFMWAALSGSRTTPRTDVNLDFVFGDAMVGREIFHDVYLEGGFRRLALNINATVDTDSAARSPGYWDPLIGLTYRKELGKKWRIMIHGDGGGFGVGSDVDVSATGRAEWQFARHFGLTMGYGGMHFSDSDTQNGQTLTISPTLHGPIIGFGIFF
jgi:hypothetical protein